jgi:hypothetical protein
VHQDEERLSLIGLHDERFNDSMLGDIERQS